MIRIAKRLGLEPTSNSRRCYEWTLDRFFLGNLSQL